MSTLYITSNLQDGVIMNTATGRISVPELLNYVAAHSGEWKTTPVLWDFNEADFSELTSEQIRRYLNGLKNVIPERENAKSALVSSKDLSFGMLRMTEVFFDIQKIPLNVRVFRDINSALAWLKE